MTCIVGCVAEDGSVYIGADSAGVDAWGSMTIRVDKKVFRTGPFLIGFTDSFRMGQLLRFKLQVPDQPAEQDIFAYMATTFVDAVRACLKDGGYAKKEAEVEQGGLFLVGYAGRLFRVDRDYQVGESLHGYEAIGSGGEVAKGAMFVSEKGWRYRTADRIARALEAAETWNANVRAPFHVERLPAPARPGESPLLEPEPDASPLLELEQELEQGKFARHSAIAGLPDGPEADAILALLDKVGAVGSETVEEALCRQGRQRP